MDIAILRLKISPSITDDVGKSFPICPHYDNLIDALPAPSRLQAIEI
jgi:hypothetical protein